MNAKKEIVLIGAGIMSATLAVLLKKLDPNCNIKIYEMQDSVASESSQAMNNAGTGHSGFCELNYTPLKKDGSVDIKKAVEIASEFVLSKEFWSYLVLEKYISDPSKFIHTTPHFSFVNNAKDVAFLKTRYETLKSHPLFRNMEYSQDPKKIKSWLPLIMKERNPSEHIAATKMKEGTDIDFESLTKEIIHSLTNKKEVELFCGHVVTDLKKKNQWHLKIKNLKNKQTIDIKADFVFIGAGGGSILLLEKSKIPEAQLFGGFPVGGQWLVCDNEQVIKKHKAKVYGQAKIGAPPMSVPHLDTRIINGKPKLLFGPFAVFSTKFLKNGSYLDLFKSLQINNIGFISQAGLRNLDLTKYLIEQVSLSKNDKVNELKAYLPSAKAEDWHEQEAGQRVQVIKKDGKNGGVLEFGTQVVTSSDGSIAALLGASPGASTSVYIMLEVIKKCFGENYNEWEPQIKCLIPSYGKSLTDLDVVLKSEKYTKKILKL